LGEDADSKPILGTGNFVVTVLVTEVDEYGAAIQELAEDVEKKRTDIISRVTGFLK
jgi:hypothetical protein